MISKFGKQEESFILYFQQKIMADRKEVIKMTPKNWPVLKSKTKKAKMPSFFLSIRQNTRFVFLYLNLTQPANVQFPRNANIFNRCKVIRAICLRERLQLWFLVTLRIRFRGLRMDPATPPLPAWRSVLQNDSISGCVTPVLRRQGQEDSRKYKTLT